MRIILVCLAFALLCSFRQPVLRSRVDSIARAQVGVRERTGNNDGREVEMYLAVCKLGPGKYSLWCASFVSWCYLQAGVKANPTPWAPAWFPKARLIDPKAGEIPQRGDVVGFRWGKGRIKHIGIVHKYTPDYTITIEGNTNGAGSRNGDGVYLKRRPFYSCSAYADWIGGAR
jgi:cell wall-associated NlpC family hydrolase